MAEAPRLATRLLDAGDYAGFAAYVMDHGWARSDAATIAGEARRLHAELQAVRHPPGPTPAWLAIMRLVESGHLDAAALDAK
jgi:hypothetical protein